MLVTSILSFFPTFSALSETYIIILATFILLSANAFNLNKFKILSFGKKLNYVYPLSLTIPLGLH